MIKNKKIKAVIFDLDGVLVEAKEWHYLALNKALKHFGFKIDRVEHLTTYDGLPTKVKLNRLSKEKRLPIKLQSFISELKQKYTEEFFFTECKPNFYHQALMIRLKEENYKIVVASNSIRNTVKSALKLSNLLKYVDFFLSNEDVSKPKPSPEIYKKATKKLKMNSKNILVVEDNFNGIRAAKSARCNLLEVENVNDVNEINVFNKIYAIEENKI